MHVTRLSTHAHFYMPTALLAVLFLVVVLTDARSAAILALDSYAVVLADARPTAFLAPASSAVTYYAKKQRLRM
jgi:hypothetical protein